MADRVNGILLDTSVVVTHLRGQIDVFALTAPTGALFLSLVALGELYKGAEKSARPAYNRQLVDDFLQIAALLFPDQTTAECYAGTAVALETNGQIIPENDPWIAAVVLECDLPPRHARRSLSASERPDGYPLASMVEGCHSLRV